MKTSPAPNQQAAHVGLAAGIVAMSIVVAASNYLVQIPINDWLTWAAFTYPVAFLVTDLTNRRLGPQMARRVIYAGFALGVALSFYTSTGRIALASGTAFLCAQLLDVWLFNRLRAAAPWWQAPALSSTVASALDTVLFFALAFALTDVPWVTLAAGDYVAKLAVAGAMLIPFRLLMGREDWAQAKAGLSPG